MNRRNFVEISLMTGGGIALLGACSSTDSLTAKYVKDPFDVEQAREIVYYAHSNLEKVKELATKTPHLINATVDWGDGDFESALGAASHVANQDIAKFLIGKGARPDLFTMAMLGHTELVVGMLKLHPGLINSIGPHGFTLLHHSEIGVESAELSDYLRENGLTEKFVETFEK